MNSTESTGGSFLLPDYHIFPFGHIHVKYSDLIEDNYINKPLAIRINSVRTHLAPGRELPPDEAHAALLNVLKDIEREFRKATSKHSCFYWIHLYRRLAPRLSPKLGISVGPMTLLWVRGIAEQAIFKFGVARGLLDAQLATHVSSRKILGGFLVKSLAKMRDADFASFYIHKISKSSQWVLTDFRPSDLAGMYFVEGLAYQYWYISAKLRACGKGISIRAESGGSVEEIRSPEQDWLIESYDKRIDVDEPTDGFATNVGTYVRDTEPKVGTSVPCLSCNVTQETISEIDGVRFRDLRSKEDFVPNYVLGWLDAAEYYVAHRYLEKSFKRKHGFGLREFCLAACAISSILIGSDLSGRDETLDRSNAYDVCHKLQRGYIFSSLTIEQMKELVLEFCRDPLVNSEFCGSAIDSEIDLIFDFLTLTSEKQSAVGLWSLGPRFVIVPYQKWFFYDLSAWVTIFRNLFFGLRNYDPKSKKGPEFEFLFAELARKKGLEVVLESKEIVLGGQNREVDVAIRVGDRLFVCECRASERPLDFEIGNPATIRARNDDLYSKVKQSMSLVELFKEHPRGSNYDVTWAKDIVAIVVSPYVEWIWSMCDELWISKDNFIPRIMASGEALNFIRGSNDQH
ncbi:hypothetical protein [Paraburkholderia mimosarum]|uniref:hypothetical protein n=1 Tax=Paraburkholderia mimosarum TaxID=312026 RepID=UPI00040A6233|nr:hypothetical protein [Paraburkholderia mimosarum]